MDIRDQLARVIATDSRYTIEAYAFVLEGLKLARSRKLRARRKREERLRGTRRKKKRESIQGKEGDSERQSGHVTGRELCLAARQVALRYYGPMALTVLERWGLHSTSDIGEIVYNLIRSGDLDKTPSDKRSDFDDVYDFATALRPEPKPVDEGEEAP
ncbi:hypothetical protein OJF2_66960 [Aquisphaera giovannonii]|uniref:Uncharacterized protein n=1 Tax=Aquisphaera giovannonii TaxID=406548 RepID=A0A5B9WBP0_9BACT|nr:Minf_1886 family protein [Aquisphaera giovannonii]QEH38098.1 hypothetical protein OJF2_66960 [Aquisphaera giovannonii]